MSLKINSYVYFGRYNLKPIKWICVEKDDESITLLSKHVLCNKIYQNGDNDYIVHSRGIGRGLNDWYHSNIREWLNSKDKCIEEWNQGAPCKENCYYYNCFDEKGFYDNERGFLNSFSYFEIVNLLEMDNNINGTDFVSLPNNKDIQKWIISKHRKTKDLNGRQVSIYSNDEGDHISKVYNFFEDEFFQADAYETNGIMPYLKIKTPEIIRGRGTYTHPFRIVDFIDSYTNIFTNGFKKDDFIEFGTFNNKPILWRCIEINFEQIILHSEFILFDKEFDEIKKDYRIIKEDTSLIKWLNCGDENILDHSKDINDDYIFKNGFLTAFNKNEFKLLAKNYEDVELDPFDFETYEEWEFYYNLDYKLKINRVFILSFAELKDYYRENNIFNKPCKDKLLDIRKDGKYWTLTPFIKNENSERKNYNKLIVINEFGHSDSEDCDKLAGVVPAIRLNTNRIMSGDGSRENPFKVV